MTTLLPDSDIGPCLRDEQFAAWQAHMMAPDELQISVRHAASCPRCRAILGELVRVSQSEDDSRLGRYEVIETLASGGMGVVLRAYDPLLSREVAVKICRQDELDTEGHGLLNEARTLAKVRHPNVVPVYDIGIVDDEVYIAMELVEGTSLTDWSYLPREVEERLAIARDIGDGLTAIHRAGCVHRDLKPDNVMVREDGTAVIVDLGLAQSRESKTSQSRVPVGTHGFISPEVVRGEAFTPLCDQYQWGVILRDALKLHEAVPQLVSVIARASAQSPDARFPSIDEALKELESKLSSSHIRILPNVYLSGLAILVAVGALLAWGLWPETAIQKSGVVSDPRCDARIGWSQKTKNQVDSNLQRHRASATVVVSWIDDRAILAQTLTREFCHAAELGDEASRRRQACVAKAWRSTVSVIRKLRDGDREQVFGGIDDLATLLELERCKTGSVLAISEKLSSDVAKAGTEANSAMHAAMAVPSMTSEERITKLGMLRDSLESLGQPLVVARWHEELAGVYAAQGNLKRASEEFAVAYTLGMKAGDDEFSTAMLVLQVSVTPTETSEDARKQLHSHAQAAVARVGNQYWAIQLEQALAKIAHTKGDNDKAVTLFRSAISGLQKIRLQPHQMELSMMQNLGAVLLESGKAKGAAELLSEAMPLAKLRWSKRSPHYWNLQTALATSYLGTGDYQIAADALVESSEGLDSINAAPYSQGIVQSYLAAALLGIGKYSEARLAADNAVDLVARDTGESPALVWPLIGAAQAALRESDSTAALGSLLRAQAICNEGSCRQVEKTVMTAYLAVAFKRTGKSARGKALARSALAALSEPGFEQAHSDLLAAFPSLRGK